MNFDIYKNNENAYAQFKEDAFKELGIENNPKREKLFDISWSMGHAYGYSEVFTYMQELVILIEDD